jgi:hypothetical protein
VQSEAARVNPCVKSFPNSVVGKRVKDIRAHISNVLKFVIKIVTLYALRLPKNRIC